MRRGASSVAVLAAGILISAAVARSSIASGGTASPGGAPGARPAGTELMSGSSRRSRVRPSTGISPASRPRLTRHERADPRAERGPQDENVAYDGRFTFTRIRFEAGLGGGFRRFGRGGGAPWAHDYPRAERNFVRILDETTAIDPYPGGNILPADDPEIFKYPVAYIVEVGYWRPDPAEIRTLRSYLEKGGFLIVDDFRGPDWSNFQDQMRKILPGSRLRELDVSHPVFHSFFEIESLDLAPPTFRQFEPAYYGVFEDDDPRGRLMVVANYNNDIGDYWEWSDAGYVPIDLSNEAYKLGVNYVVYAMTH